MQSLANVIHLPWYQPQQYLYINFIPLHITCHIKHHLPHVNATHRLVHSIFFYSLELLFLYSFHIPFPDVMCHCNDLNQRHIIMHPIVVIVARQRPKIQKFCHPKKTTSGWSNWIKYDIWIIYNGSAADTAEHAASRDD